MIPWLDGAIPYLKAIHVAALVLWCGGLFALPLMLARHDPAIRQADYRRIRLATHFGYIWAVTPAAMLAVAAGILLIFLREVFVVWMFAKLVVVTLLVGFHAWVGHTIVGIAESEGELKTPEPLAPLLLLLVLVLAILFLVLAKPDLEQIPPPDWLLKPRDGQLPFDVPPRL